MCAILVNYMVAHMADRRPRTNPTAHQTPVCRKREKKSAPRPAAPTVTKRFQRRFRENGGNESPRRSNLFLSVFSVRGDAGEQTGAASSWMRCNAQILAATAAAAAAARSIQPTKAERREWGGGRESRASNYRHRERSSMPDYLH